ncbi:MAG: lysophospholipid acyltransferase family protein [Prevotella sp.]|nr:lysophospholipid acyltransferase family protein [Prevotella sp.]MCM1074914.1 lysophospholipid acyltransferase family protein [Ruminococcus sp.]
MKRTVRDNHLTMRERIAMAPLGCLLWIISKMPFCILHLLADILAFLARDVVRYRRRIVRANIRDCFPEMSAEEQLKTERGFYKHLADYFFETVKFTSMSVHSLCRHMVFENTSLIDKTLSSGKDIIIYTSHFGNWEWITSMGLWCKDSDEATFSHVYRPLRQQWFNNWFFRLRSRYNVSIPMHNVFRTLLEWRRDNHRWICGFLSDQKPSHSGKVYTVPFLGRETPFIGGTEDLARKLKTVVMYFDTEVIGRSYYKSTIRLLCDKPTEAEPGEITRLYAETLEAQIRRYPQAYLWSHNRWKLKK